jgi:small subunit ribosomal protein S17
VERNQSMHKTKLGRVVSSKMDKTVVVAVDSAVIHRIYKKSMRRTNRFMAHDENNMCHVGDTVRIEESRPRSKQKRWQVLQIVERGVEL